MLMWTLVCEPVSGQCGLEHKVMENNSRNQEAKTVEGPLVSIIKFLKVKTGLVGYIYL